MDRDIFVWPDVDAVLRHRMEEGRWPSWLVSASAYSYGLSIEVLKRDASAADVRQWLFEVFGGSFRTADSGDVIMLSDRRFLPVEVEYVVEEKQGQLRFLFDQAATIRRPARVNPSLVSQDDPVVYAFHSFKGGVGRTTASIGLTQEICAAIGDAGKVLLVDADLEAPGISFLIEERWPSYPASFSDLLALANDGQQYGEACNEVASRIAGLGLGNVYFLPAFRGGVAYDEASVRPEHLIKNSRDPFVVSSLMRQLGRTLMVDAVVVDLRAGVSEISAGLALDPTVKRVLVTTLSGQSFTGTTRLLRRLGRWDRMLASLSGREEGYEPPHVVLSQVHDSAVEVAENEYVPAVLRAYLGEDQLATVASGEPDGKEEVESGAAVSTSIVQYFEGLARLDPSWEHANVAIARTGLGASMRGLLAPLAIRRSAADASAHALEKEPAAEGERDEQRTKIEEFSDSLEFAESGAGRGFLATDSIRNLVNDFKVALPNVAVIGKKGAGKSYMFLQMVQSRTWQDFCARAGIESAVRGRIFPVLAPANLESRAEALVEEARTDLSGFLNTQPQGLLESRDFIRRAQSLGENEADWRVFWLELMANAVGYRSFDLMVDGLRDSGQKVVLIVDGLEDVFQSLHDDKVQQAALRSLAGDVLSWISKSGSDAVGIVCFVRHDMIASAVRQNFGQFFQRYKQYALRWGRAEALRLVGWIAEQSGALAINAEEGVDEARMSENLIPLWGQKLGSSNANEAHTSEWVLAALSDFRGQVQARDVVRFLKISASKSRGSSTWSDRVLTPPAIRSAPEICGQKKVEEVEQESPKLRAIFKHLKEAAAERRVIPFKPSDFDLSAADLDLLEREGVVLREADGYYMPEMYRRGLAFSLPRGARPRVLALARRAKGVMPFL